MNAKIPFIFILFISFSIPAIAQKYMTRSGHIWFFSHTPIEDIEAHNYQTSSILDTSTGDLVYSMLIKGFQFEKALMQEHFNEKYMESEKFPKATFKGKILEIENIDLKNEGTHDVKVQGALTIHGVTQDIETLGTLSIGREKIQAKATFKILVADYKIKIPGVVRDNIAESIDVHVIMEYSPL